MGPQRAKLLRTRTMTEAATQLNVEVAHLLMLSNLVLGPVLLCGLTLSMLVTGKVAQATLAFPALVATLLLTALFLRRRQALARWQQRPGISPASAAVAGAVVEMVQGAAARMGVDVTRIAVYVDRYSGAVSPAVLPVSGGDALLLPLGFMKTLSASPAHARSMLEHEIAHVQQKDSRYMVTASLFWDLAMHVLMPVLLAYLILLLALSGRQIGAAARFGVLAGADSAAAVQRMMAIPSLVGTTSSPPEIEVALDQFTASTELMLVNFAAASRRNSLFEAWVEEALVVIPAGLFPVLWTLLVFGGVRRARRKCEELADNAVVLFSDGTALRDALLANASERPRWRRYSLHPSPRERIRKIEEWLAQVSQDEKDGAPMLSCGTG